MGCEGGERGWIVRSTFSEQKRFRTQCSVSSTGQWWQRIGRHRCLRLAVQDAQGALGIRGRQRAPVEATVMEKQKVLRDKIAQLASEDPRLLKALVDYRDKYQVYLSERSRRCVGGPLVCGDGDQSDQGVLR